MDTLLSELYCAHIWYCSSSSLRIAVMANLTEGFSFSSVKIFSPFDASTLHTSNASKFLISSEAALSITTAFNEMSATVKALQSALDTLFLLSMTLFIFVMQAGFCFMEAGIVRSKNTTHILLKSMLDAFIGGFSYWIFGYAIAWGEGNSFVGWTYFASHNLPPSRRINWLFQCMFANTASTIVSGAVAERLEFGAYLVYSFFLTGFVYPPVSRWAWWPDGWLKSLGFSDFGGSAVVHMLGGCCALVASIMVGPRLGRFDGSKTKFIKGHSVPLTCLGAFFLLIGFVSFNSVSGSSLSKPGDVDVVSTAACNTFLAGCGGALSAVLFARVVKIFRTYEKKRAWSFMSMANGAVVGMVASCAGCNNLQPWAAFVTGATAAPFFLTLRWLLPKLKVDDPLDAFPVHFGGGFWGTLMAPLLSNEGVFLKGDKASAMSFVYNLAGIVSIFTWGTTCCLVLFGLLKYFKKLRVDPEMEIRGLDLLEHGEPAYPYESWLEEQYGTSESHLRATASLSDMTNSPMERTRRRHNGPSVLNLMDINPSKNYVVTKNPPKKRADWQNSSFDFPLASQVGLASFY